MDGKGWRERDGKSDAEPAHQAVERSAIDGEGAGGLGAVAARIAHRCR